MNKTCDNCGTESKDVEMIFFDSGNQIGIRNLCKKCKYQHIGEHIGNLKDFEKWNGTKKETIFDKLKSLFRKFKIR